jgi:hypothetical protein
VNAIAAALRLAGNGPERVARAAKAVKENDGWTVVIHTGYYVEGTPLGQRAGCETTPEAPASGVALLVSQPQNQ